MLAIALVQLGDVLEVGGALRRKSTLPQERFDFLQAVLVGEDGDIFEQLFSRDAGDWTTISG